MSKLFSLQLIENNLCLFRFVKHHGSYGDISNLRHMHKVQAMKLRMSVTIGSIKLAICHLLKSPLKKCTRGEIG